jgi:hypothetical protein
MAYKDPQDPRALESRRKHYRENREVYKTRARAHAQGKQDYIREAKRRPCADCGVEYPHFVMDFDHVPERGPKVYELATAHYLAWKKIYAERKICNYF